jgi:hypothetical protein
VGVVFVGTAAGDSAGTVEAFVAAGCGRSSCSAVWSRDLDEPVTGAPAVTNGHLDVATGVRSDVVEVPGTGHVLAFTPG